MHNCKIYKIKSCICFDTGTLYKENIIKFKKIIF